MFQSFQFRDLHKSTYRLVVENFAVRREHWSELEVQHFRESATYCAIDSNLLVRLLTSEAHCLKDDGAYRRELRSDPSAGGREKQHHRRALRYRCRR